MFGGDDDGSQAASAFEFGGSAKPLAHHARMDDTDTPAPYRCMQRAPDMRSIVDPEITESSQPKPPPTMYHPIDPSRRAL
jgi:hypothetical protein